MKKTAKLLSAALLLAIIVLSAVSCGEYNYMKKDLSKYIHIDSDDYTGIPVTLYSNYEVTDLDVEKAIRLFRIDNRTLRKSASTTAFIDYGDDAYI